jgi:hypothetical protein
MTYAGAMAASARFEQSAEIVPAIAILEGFRKFADAADLAPLEFLRLHFRLASLWRLYTQNLMQQADALAKALHAAEKCRLPEAREVACRPRPVGKFPLSVPCLAASPFSSSSSSSSSASCVTPGKHVRGGGRRRGEEGDEACFCAFVDLQDHTDPWSPAPVASRASA